MTKKKIPKELVDLFDSLPSKRAKIVIQHIVEHGSVSTEDLEKTYGYNHPPRAARDVREAGIPLETFKIKSSDGRSIAAYRFGDLSKIDMDKLGGRKTFSKKFKDYLYSLSDGRCAICLGDFHSRYLQVDHRIPYEIAGDSNNLNKKPDDYMLLCTSCNRAKSWSCEHCPNWQNDKLSKICEKCYWAYPESYTHIALNEIRRLDIVWSGDEVVIYEKLKKSAIKNETSMPEFVKKIVKKYANGK